jgi:myosin heavy subunit
VLIESKKRDSLPPLKRDSLTYTSRENNIRELKRELKEFEDREMDAVQMAMRKFSRQEETRVREEIIQEKRQLNREVEEWQRNHQTQIRSELERQKKDLLSNMESELERREEELEAEYTCLIEKKMEQVYKIKIDQLTEKNIELKKKVEESIAKTQNTQQARTERVTSSIDNYKYAVQEENKKHDELAKRIKELNEMIEQKQQLYIEKQLQPKKKVILEETQQEEIQQEQVHVYEEPTFIPVIKRESNLEQKPNVQEEVVQELEEHVLEELPKVEDIHASVELVDEPDQELESSPPPSNVNPRSYAELLSLLSNHYYDEISPEVVNQEQETWVQEEEECVVVEEPVPVDVLSVIEEELLTPIFVQPIVYEQIIVEDDVHEVAYAVEEEEEELTASDELDDLDSVSVSTPTEAVEEPTIPQVLTPTEHKESFEKHKTRSYSKPLPVAPQRDSRALPSVPMRTRTLPTPTERQKQPIKGTCHFSLLITRQSKIR